MRRLTISVMCISVCLSVPRSFAGDREGLFTPDELAELKAGRIVRQELKNSRQNGFYGGTGWAVINAPAERIWRAIIDWESYPEIFPNTVEMRELSRKGQRSLLRMRMGHPILKVMYHLEMSKDGDQKTLRFKLIKSRPHDLEAIRGYWRLFPQKGNRTLVAYVIGLQAPMGIVNLVSKSFEDEAMEGILGAPKFVKEWVETKAADQYR